MSSNDAVAARYVEPKSLDEAKRRQQELVDRITNIDAQLTQRKTQRAPHCPSSESDPAAYRQWREELAEYQAWRGKAIVARRFVEGELRRVKRWILDHRRTAPSEYSLIRSLVDLVEELKDDGVELDDAEEELLRAAKDFVKDEPRLSAVQ